MMRLSRGMYILSRRHYAALSEMTDSLARQAQGGLRSSADRAFPMRYASFQLSPPTRHCLSNTQRLSCRCLDDRHLSTVTHADPALARGDRARSVPSASWL